MSKNNKTNLSVRGVKPTGGTLYSDRGSPVNWPCVCSLIRGETPSKCAASYWDFLPEELQELCYQINHKRAMREVLEQMKEDCFSLSNHEGLGGCRSTSK